MRASIQAFSRVFHPPRSDHCFGLCGLPARDCISTAQFPHLAGLSKLACNALAASSRRNHRVSYPPEDFSPCPQRSLRDFSSATNPSTVSSPCVYFQCWVSVHRRARAFAPAPISSHSHRRFRARASNSACLWSKGGQGLLNPSELGRPRSYNNRIFSYKTPHCSEFSSTCILENCPSFHAALNQLELPGSPADPFIFTSLVQQCSHAKSLIHGRLLHSTIFMDNRLCENAHLMSLLVQMYGLCTALEDAHAVFLQILQKNVYSWNIMMGTSAKHGKFSEIANLYERMQIESVLPDKYSIVTSLSAHIELGSLSGGKSLHAQFAHSEIERDVVVGTALINLYGHGGCPKYAKSVFEELHERDLVSCNAMVAVYAQQGQNEEAFQFFDHMLQQGFLPNKVTFLGVVDACDDFTGLSTGKKLHAYASHTGSELDAFVLTTLLSMYGKCNDADMADILFDKLSERHVVSWNAIIAVHAHQNHQNDVFQLFIQMQQEGSIPDMVTYRTILCSFTGPTSMSKGKLLHALITNCPYNTDMVVRTALFSMYGRCGSFASARELFDDMPKKDVVAWNAMIALYAQNALVGEALQLIKLMQDSGVCPDKVTLISGLSACAAESFEVAQHLFEKVRVRDVVVWNAMLGACEQHGYSEQACTLFEKMLGEGINPDKVTYLTMLSLCASMSSVVEGKWMHFFICDSKFESDGMMVCGLINMYDKCCCVYEACLVFQSSLERDASVFNSIIMAYTEHGHNKEVLQIWARMQQEAVLPDEVTYIGILNACATDNILPACKSIHACITKSDYGSEISVATSLFNAYHKCSSLEEAHLVFFNVAQHDVVSWTAIISANAEQNESKVVLYLFRQMQIEGVHADSGIYVNVLTACADESALTQAKILHLEIIYNNLKPDVSLGNALMNMYCKCGSVEGAQREFYKVTGRDAMSFNIMIAGFAQYGHGMEALQLYDQMQQEDTIPNEYTLSSTLSACSHGGFVEEGKSCLRNMIEGYCCTPSIEHYDCMVDLLGRSGQLEEAETLLNEIPWQPTIVSYMTLFGAARTQMDVDKGEHVSWHLFELDAKDASSYVALANLYASAGKGADVLHSGLF